MFFYELHEGENEVFSDVLVVSESEWEPEEFLELVQTIRRRIQDGFIHDTLSEAIAIELERDHGFIHVSDDRLVASVNIDFSLSAAAVCAPPGPPSCSSSTTATLAVMYWA